MAYCTLDDLKAAHPEKQLIQMTNDVSGGTEIVQTVVDECIASAEALIDGYVPSRAKPLDPAPRLINEICVALTLFNLHKRVSRLSDDQRKERDYQMKLLKDIRSGLIDLGDEAPTVETNHCTVSYSADDQMFSMDAMSSL